jgi:glucosamine-6-phosphate deaminase
VAERLTAAAGTPVLVYDDADALGAALAHEILEEIVAKPRGERYLLGCPGGRSLRSTYQALARLVPPDADLRGLVIVMMDEYVVETPDGQRRIDPAAHFSCGGFAAREIVGPLDAAVPRGHGIDTDHVWGPDPVDPLAYDRRIEAAGGVDHFLTASGAGDGHVAFVPPPADPGGRSSVIRLAEQTRRDNMATFPDFGTLDSVPRWGVSVGLGTIRDLSRRVTLVLHGDAKRASAARIVAAPAFDPAWPATFIHGCPDPRILLDRAAAAGFTFGSAPDGRAGFDAAG